MTYSIADLRNMTAAECGKALAIGRYGHGWLELDNAMSIAFSVEAQGVNQPVHGTLSSYIVEFLPNDEPRSHIDEIAVDGFFQDDEFNAAAYRAVTEVIVPALEKRGF